MNLRRWLRSQDSNLASGINSPLPTPSLLDRNIPFDRLFYSGAAALSG